MIIVILLQAKKTPQVDECDICKVIVTIADKFIDSNKTEVGEREKEGGREGGRWREREGRGRGGRGGRERGRGEGEGEGEGERGGRGEGVHVSVFNPPSKFNLNTHQLPNLTMSTEPVLPTCFPNLFVKFLCSPPPGRGPITSQ